MLKYLRDNIQRLKLTASSKNLDETIRLTELQLKELTAQISLEKIKMSSKNQLTATVRIKNSVGHKFPSGFPSRRTWIHFVIKDQEGAILFESGRPNENGSIAGNDNDDDITSFEPHYEIINRPDQVQIYESIMANTDQEVTYTLLRAGSYLKDNRLLPEGFDKRTANSDIGVYGAANNDENFDGGGDHITYQITQDNLKNVPLTVEVELLFEPVAYSFVKELRKHELKLVDDFIYYWDKLEKSPVVISSVTRTINN